MGAVTIIPVEGIGEVTPGMDVATAISDALDAAGVQLANDDVVVVTHKIVSKAEGRVVELADDSPDAHRHLVFEEAKRIIRRRGDLVIAETRHGFICANAGVDRSNAGPARAVLLPEDPDRSANRIRIRLAARYGVDIAVIVSDTFGRAWRRGVMDVAIGVAGMSAITDLRGEKDAYGMTLEVSEIATADELAAAADLAMGKSTGIPVAIVRGAPWRPGTDGIKPMIRPPEEDLFR